MLLLVRLKDTVGQVLIKRIKKTTLKNRDKLAQIKRSNMKPREARKVTLMKQHLNIFRKVKLQNTEYLFRLRTTGIIFGIFEAAMFIRNEFQGMCIVF